MGTHQQTFPLAVDKFYEITVLDMKETEITKGCLVIIQHSKEGGEVIEANRPDGRFLVKVARMKVNATGIKTQIVNVLADADDLEPIKKQKKK